MWVNAYSVCDQLAEAKNYSSTSKVRSILLSTLDYNVGNNMLQCDRYKKIITYQVHSLVMLFHRMD